MRQGKRKRESQFPVIPRFSTQTPHVSGGQPVVDGQDEAIQLVGVELAVLLPSVDAHSEMYQTVKFKVKFSWLF